MKSLVWIILSAFISASCRDLKNDDIACTFDDRNVKIRNASTTIRIDNDLYFGIVYDKNAELHPLTDENKTNPSIFLSDSANERISFERKTTSSVEINNKFGKGEKVKIEALSHDGRIKCSISLSSYNKLPNVILVQSSFINISEKNYFIQDYTLNQILLHPPLMNPNGGHSRVLPIVGK